MASLTYFRRVSYTNSHSSFHCGIYFGNLREKFFESLKIFSLMDPFYCFKSIGNKEIRQ